MARRGYRGCAGGSSEALEDGPRGDRWMDLGKNAHARAAARALEHVEFEDAAHQLGPGVTMRCGCGRLPSRVETLNYRTVGPPTGTEVPTFVKDEFAEFYRAMFTEQVRREAMRAVFLEYAWDMNWCDPCAADPLSVEELR